MLWTANIDEIHDVEVIVRSVTGGVGAMLWNYPAPPPTPPSNEFRIVYDGTTPVPTGQRSSSTLLNNLNGSLAQLVQSEFCSSTDPECDSTAIDDWNKIDAFIRGLRAPRAPTELDAAQVSAGQLLFTEGGCAACHAGPGWTLSRVFYTPGANNNGSLLYSKPAVLEPAALGALRTVSYSVPTDLLALNPPVQATGSSATLRRWEPGTQALVDYAYDAATHRNDQINCVLRAVGTFPEQPAVAPWATQGIAAQEGPSVLEVRSSMKLTDLAVGQTGFNIPSLLGVAAGAPYFHGGNARTLEEVFDDAFRAHHQAVARGFLPADELNRADKVRALVVYLLSIDDTKEPVTVEDRFDFCKPSSPIE
jgi:hypothetical protein